MMNEMNEYTKWDMLSKLNVGDKVKLTNDEVAEFVRLKQKNFIGIMNGQSYNIPVTMFVEVVEKAESKTPELTSLRKGETFYINKNGSALLFIFETMQKGKIIGINPITKAKTRIDKEMYAGKVDEL